MAALGSSRTLVGLPSGPLMTVRPLCTRAALFGR